IPPNSEVRYQALGVLKLTLYANGYTWQLVPVAGESYADSGTALCHGTPGSQPPPPPPPPPPADSNPVVDAGFNLRGSPGAPVTLAFRVLDSNEPGGEGAWTYSIDWGDGSATDASLAAVAVPNTLTHTYAASGAFHVHVTVRD